MIGKGHKGVLVTPVDRATRETKIKALSNRKANNVAQACIDLLSQGRLQSNSKDFAQHKKIADSLNTSV